MTKGAAYLTQSQSDLRVFKALLKDESVESCHALHYLQMMSEKLSKAIIESQNASSRPTHKAFSKLTTVLMNQRYAAIFSFKSIKSYFDFLRRVQPLIEEIEILCPALADTHTNGEDMPNVEYPWRLANFEWNAPCLHSFTIYERLKRDNLAKSLIWFLEQLCAHFSEI